MSITYDCYTGIPSKVISNLKRSISQYANSSSYIKIGITNDPERRWKEHKSKDSEWGKMIVVYESISSDNTKKIERELVSHTSLRTESWNFIAGGGGCTGEGSQYVYFLISK